MIHAGTPARRLPWETLLGSAYAQSAGLPCAPASGLDDIVADGVAHQRRRGVEVQLAVSGRAMRLDRLHAQIEDRRNPLVAMALRNQLHDRAFARRERTVVA